MHSTRFIKLLAILATSFLSSAYADGSVGCPAQVAVILNKQQTSEYIDSPSFSMHKRMVGNDAAHMENIDHFRSSCGAEHIDFTQVGDLKQGSPYVISGTKGSVDKALEHIQSTVKDYVVVLDHKAHLQKRQQETTPSPSKSAGTAPSNSNSLAPSSTISPGPTINPGKNQSRAEQLRSKFWTVGLLTGLLTTVIMVLILLVGICWLASIEGPTRFENVKQKRS